MDLNEVFSGSSAAMDKFASFWNNQSQFSSGANKILSSKQMLKKLKMKAGDGFMIVPTPIHLPITPPMPKVIKTADPMPYPGSFKTAIKLIKKWASESTDYAEALKEILGDTFSSLDLTSTTVSDDECKVFRKFRQPLIYSQTVMAVKSSTSPYGTKYAVNICTDDEGRFIDSPKNPIIWNLHNLETACIAGTVKQIREENENSGAKRRTEQAISDQIKSLWDNRTISNPYSLGTTRVLFFDTDRDYHIIGDAKSNWKADTSGIMSNEFYITTNRKIVERFMSIIGTAKDRYDDFLLILQNTPSFDEKTRGTAAQGISRSPASSDERIEAELAGFVEAYAAYRDDFEKWDEKVIKNSAFEYRKVSDDAIIEIFKHSIGTLSSMMQTKEIYDRYSDTITRLDSELAGSIIETELESGLAQLGDISAELKEAPVVTENTPGYGGDTEVDDTQAMMDALTS